MTYEESIHASAERLGYTVEPEGEGLRVIAPSGLSAWHRLGGVMEKLYEDRQENEELTEPGYWVAAKTTAAPKWREVKDRLL